MVADLAFEIRRQPAQLAALGEDGAQYPDARRQRVAVAVDRLDQQVEQPARLFGGQLKLHSPTRAERTLDRPDRKDVL